MSETTTPTATPAAEESTELAPGTRIYFVQGENEFRLVRAKSRQAAIGHVVGGRYKADIADQETLVAAVADGVKVETAA